MIAERPIAAIEQVDGLQGALDERPAVGLRAHYLDAYNDFFSGASGAHPDARWANTSHLTHDGLVAWAAFVVASQVDGEYIITGTTPKVVWFGDSWISQEPAVLTSAVTDRIAGATVVVSGVGGNNSDDLIARFTADVPTDADYVIINEPGVNDVYAHSTFSDQKIAANLETLVGMIRGVGAIPVIVGPPPLVELPTRSASVARQMEQQVGDGKQYPSVTTGGVLGQLLTPRATRCLAIGDQAQQQVTGSSNTAIGYQAQLVLTSGTSNLAIGALAQAALTTGGSNTAVGSECQYPLTTGNNNTGIGAGVHRQLLTGSGNTAVGQGAQNALTSANFNTSVGQNSLLGVTTGGSNTAIGISAGYAPNSDAANKTTTGIGQVLVGGYTGLGTTAQDNYITCLGYKVTAVGAGAVAIGTDSTGAGAAATASNDFVLGTANHHVKVPGKLTASGVVKSLTAATAGRPAANTAGAGAMMYDTTISKPIWSDGTTWRDAAGTEV